MKINIGDILVIKLNSGDEIIGKIDNLAESKVVVDKPISFKIIPDEKSAKLIPVPISAVIESKIHINLNSIVWLSKPNKDVEKIYIQITTGIMPATKIPTGSSSSIEILNG